MAVSVVKVEGLENVLGNLATAIALTKRQTRRGLIKSAFVIKDGSIRNSQVDLGNLRSSHFIHYTGGSVEPPAWRAGGGSRNSKADVDKLNAAHSQLVATMNANKDPLKVFVGVGAYYAVYVHEAAPSANQPSAEGGPKFMQRSIAENTDNILKIIHNEASI